MTVSLLINNVINLKICIQRQAPLKVRDLPLIFLNCQRSEKYNFRIKIVLRLSTKIKLNTLLLCLFTIPSRKNALSAQKIYLENKTKEPTTRADLLIILYRLYYLVWYRLLVVEQHQTIQFPAFLLVLFLVINLMEVSRTFEIDSIL